MLEIFLKLIDYVIKLGEVREDNRREYFDRYVEPAYQAAELIYNDYCSMLADLRDLITGDGDTEAIIRYLEERRRNLLAARTRLRALINRRITEGRVTRFEAGILGLMSGAMTSVDRPYIQLYSFANTEAELQPQLGRHTVLDILQKLQREGSDDISAIRQDLLQTIDEKSRGVDQAWQNVIAGYAEFHSSVLPAPPRKLGRRKRSWEQISEIQSLLIDIHDMLDSGQYDRQTATAFEEKVGQVLPELSYSAQDVREIIHDLDNHEPNIGVTDLEEGVTRFEQLLDDTLRELS